MSGSSTHRWLCLDWSRSRHCQSSTSLSSGFLVAAIEDDSLTGLRDRREVLDHRRRIVDSLAEVRLGLPKTRSDTERLGFHVWVQHPEDELIRAAGVAGVEGLFDSQGDLGSFRNLTDAARLVGSER
jgi:hypothetical protein